MTEFTAPSFLPVMPEIIMLGMVCLVLVVDLFLSQEKRGITLFLSLLTLVVVFIAVLKVEVGSETFNGTFIMDQLAVTLKLAVLAISFLILVYSRDYIAVRNMYRGEYFVLALFSILGMMIMISAKSFLLIYLGLELLSLSLYAMVALNRDSSKSAEAAMKYFVLGALASGILLYGISILYGITGSLNITEVAIAAAELSGQHLIAFSFAMTFIVVGLAFKFGAVPFHMWVPDVYEGAPTSVALLIGTVPKIAGFAMMIRLLAEGLPSMHMDWSQMLMVLAVISMGLGNIVAIAQTNFKRLLAYSTISHVGFIFLGVLAGTATGYSSAMFYVITYALTASVAFGVILLLSAKGYEADKISDLKGLNERSPWMAAVLSIALFSMAGLPPTVGFYAKLSVINSVIQVDMVWLALVAVLFSVIGLFYYLRVVKVMYFDRVEESDEQTPTPVFSLDSRLLLSGNSLSLIFLGLFPSLLMGYCVAAFAG